MSRTLHFHAFLWRSGTGAWAGRVLDDATSHGVSLGTTPAAVLRDLKDYIHASMPKYEFWYTPDFIEPQVRILKVQAVPEYEVRVTSQLASLGHKRIVPCKEPVALKLPYVVGKRESGLVCATVPALGVDFELATSDNLEEMALHYARQALKGLTPAALLRLLPPVEWRIESFTHVPRRTQERPEEDKLETLASSAEHVGSPFLRRAARTWERDADVSALEARLRQRQVRVLLVGESGCGKSAVLIEAARRVEKHSGESGRKPRRFWITSGARLIAGMRWLGQWQERLEGVIADITRVDGTLCVESLQELLRLGGNKPESSLAASLIPFLQSGGLRMVVEATPAEVEACERLLPGFLDSFSVIHLEPLSGPQEERLLQLAAQSLSSSNAMDFHDAAARECGRLCRRFQPYAGFPGTPLSLMNEAAARQRESGTRAVTVHDLRRVFAASTGLPEGLLDEGERMDPAVLRAWFSSRLIAQPQAVDAICRAILKFKAGLNDPRRPLAVLLFTGPTGTGKTQLAKLLGDYLFPHRPASERFVRLDMSEYSGYDAARRLLGDPFGEPSDLVKRLRQNPFTVLLLDEIEKAAPEVFDTLMNVFDEGRLSDALGRTTWFRSTVIIMTSNLGTRRGGSLGFSAAPGVESARIDAGAIRSHFRPEFFNRIDQVVTYDPLDRAAVETIARHEIAALAEREGLRQRGFMLDVSEALFQLVCDRGFDPVYGARPLQRRIEELIVTPVSRWLVAHPEARDLILKVDEAGVTPIS